MITVNLDTIILNPELLFQAYELKFEKDSILLYDLPEGSRLFPLDSSSYIEGLLEIKDDPVEREELFGIITGCDDDDSLRYRLFSKIHKILYKHEYDV